jgi:hypothetical protein
MNLTEEFGVESVSVEPIDITLYQSQKILKNLEKQTQVQKVKYTLM